MQEMRDASHKLMDVNGKGVVMCRKSTGAAQN